MEKKKKTKNENPRIEEIQRRMGEIAIVDITPKKEKSKLDINKKEEKGVKKVKIFTKIESEKDYLKRVEEKISKIQEDLSTQLADQNKFGGHFDHEIDNYLFFVRLQEAYKRDIQMNGIRINDKNGNGIDVNKSNESCQNLLKYEQQGLAILNTLNLKAPDINGETNIDDLY